MEILESSGIPAVSVIVPVYNRQHSVARAIQSVLDQSFQSWELIIVDDCSTDNSYEVVNLFPDPRIKKFQMKGNSGAASARNYGIQQSKGEYISFLDSDDSYAPEFLELSLKKIKATDQHVGFIWTGCIYHRIKFGNPEEIKAIWNPTINETPYLTFLSDLKIGTNSGITVKRKVFEKVGYFDETLPAAEDTDLFLRISQHFSFDFVPAHLIHIHQVESDRLSRRFDKIARAYNIIIPKHIREIEKHKLLRIKFYYKAMWLNYHLGDSPLARQYFTKLMKDKFFHYKAWFIFFLFELLGLRLARKLHIRVSRLDKQLIFID